METLSITYEDGSTATWFIPEDKRAMLDRVESFAISVLGQPDSIGP